MISLKIAYFGYDLFYPVLEKLLTDKNIEVLKVFSFPENSDDKHTEIKKLALKNNIEFTQEKISKEDINKLYIKGCELLVCAGYAYKIPIDGRISGINLHPALLPEGRGAWPMPLTILKGLSKTGLTVHRITKNFDDGEILKQKEYKLKNDETLESLNNWLTNNSAELLYDCTVNFDEYIKNSKPQKNGEYWKMPTKEDMSFSDKTKVSEADRIVRAFYGSGCFYINDRYEIQIKKAHVIFNNDSINADNEFVLDGGKLVVEKFL